MQVPINYAILSFCPDLTDPTAGSMPLGVVGVGTASPRKFWFFVVRDRPGDEPGIMDDAMAQEVLNNLPALLEKQLAEGARAVGTDGFLSWLHDRFRNSLHVSSLREANVDVDSAPSLINRLVSLYDSVVATQPEQPLALPAMGFTPFEPVLALR